MTSPSPACPRLLRQPGTLNVRIGTLVLILLVLSACAIGRAPRLPENDSCEPVILHAVSRIPLFITNLWRSRTEIRSCSGRTYQRDDEHEVLTKEDKSAKISFFVSQRFSFKPTHLTKIGLALDEFHDYFDALTNDTDVSYHLRLVGIPSGYDHAITSTAFGFNPKLTFYLPLPVVHSENQESLKIEVLRRLAGAGHELFHATAEAVGLRTDDMKVEEEAAYLAEICLLGKMANAVDPKMTIRIAVDEEGGVTKGSNEISQSIAGKHAALSYATRGATMEESVILGIGDGALDSICSRSKELLRTRVR